MNARSSRDPLALRVARTLRETTRDEFDWWEASPAAPSLARRIARMTLTQWVVVIAIAAAVFALLYAGRTPV